MAEVIAFEIQINGIQTVVSNVEQLNAAVRQTQQAFSRATLGSQERRELQNQLVSLTATQRQLNQQQQAAVAASGLAVGSYRAMNLELGQLRTRYRELSAEDRNGAIGTGLQRQIQALNGELVRLDAGIGNYQRNVGNYASAFEGLGSVFTNVLGGLGIGIGLKELGDLALQSESYARKSAVVLGDSLGYVTEQANKNAAAIGLTSKQYIAATTDLADLLVPMGFGRQQAAEFSTGLIDLSGALSEWTGGQKDAKQVADILQSAILGEREQLKGLGISISEADVKAQLAANGQDKLTGALLQQAEAQATYQLILAKSTDAQTAFANGANSPIRALNQLKAQAFGVVEAIASGLLVTIEDLIIILGSLATFIDNNKAALLAAGFAVAAYSASLNTARLSLLSFQIAQAGNTIVTNAASVAQKGLSLAMAAVPYVAVGLAIYGLVKAMQVWFGSTEEQIKSQEVLLASQKELTEAYSSEAQSAAELFAIAKSDISSKEQKAAAVQRIIELYPTYLGGFTSETDILNNLDTVQKSVNKGILDGAIARVKAAKLQEATTQLLDLQLKKEQAIFEAQQKGIDLNTSIGKQLIAQVDNDIATVQKRIEDLPTFLNRVGESLSNQNVDFTGLSVSDKQIKAVQDRLKEISTARTELQKRTGLDINEETKKQYDYLIAEEKHLQLERSKLVDSTLNGEKTAAAASVAITVDAETKKDKVKKESKQKEVETLETLTAKLKELQAKLSGLSSTPSKIPSSLLDDISKTKKEIDDLEKSLRKAGLLGDGEVFNASSIKDAASAISDAYNETFSDIEAGQTDLDAKLKQLHEDYLAGLILDEKAAQDEIFKAQQAKRDEDAKKEVEQRKETQQLLFNVGLDLAKQLSDTVFQIQKEGNDRELKQKTDQLEAEKDTELALANGNATLISQIERRYAAEKKELDRQAFEDNKRLAIAQALINGALAATAVFAVPDFTFGIASGIRLGFIAANTALQVAAIQTQRFAKGGLVEGQGTDTSDNIPALLSPKEFVIRAAAVRSIGVDKLTAINNTGSLASIATSLPMPQTGQTGLSQADINAIILGVREGAYQGTNSGLVQGVEKANRINRTNNKLGIK